MFDSNLNKSKLNLNAPSYVPRNFKTFENLFESNLDKNLNQFNFLDNLSREGNTFSPKSLNDLFSPNNKETFALSPFHQFDAPKEKDIYEINSFMIDKSVINRICLSSSFNQQFPFNAQPMIRDSNQDYKSNLSHIFNNRQRNLFNFSNIANDKECLLCLQAMGKGKKYGLLLNCDHVFCLECIKLWRYEFLSAKKNEMHRQCPICKAESFHVIPSEIFICEKNVKMNLAQEKKKKLSKIPCKYVTDGKNECPFSSSCFYNHSKN